MQAQPIRSSASQETIKRLVCEAQNLILRRYAADRRQLLMAQMAIIYGPSLRVVR